MTSVGYGITVEGLPKLQRTLKDLAGKEAARNLKEGSLAAATVISDGANDRLRRRGGRLGAKLARGGAIEPKGQQRHAVIKLGGARPKYKQTMAAMEFGAQRSRYNFYGRHGHVGNQYTRPVGASTPGHYVGWSAQRNGAAAVQAWGEALDRIIKDTLKRRS